MQLKIFREKTTTITWLPSLTWFIWKKQKHLPSYITCSKMKTNIIEDLFCELCSLQFDKKYVYDVHMTLVHKKTLCPQSKIDKTACNKKLLSLNCWPLRNHTTYWQKNVTFYGFRTFKTGNLLRCHRLVLIFCPDVVIQMLSNQLAVFWHC